LLSKTTILLTRYKTLKEAVAVTDDRKASFKGHEEDPEETAKEGNWPGDKEKN
jgi:hypothetical protein